MSEISKIEWTKSTFNPWAGCTKVSPGCDHCYAEVSTPARTMNIQWGAGQPRHRTTPGNWNHVRKWNRQAAASGEFWPVFTASLADVFDNEVPDAWRADFWALVRECPALTFLVLTKRIGNVARMLPADWGDGYANVRLGITVVNQAEADRDIPKLLATPAALRWLSMEPLLGAVDLTRIDIDGHREIYPLADTRGCEDGDGNPILDLPAIDWVVIGGESGPDARPMHPAWARSLRDQCAAAGVPFLFKQWGEWHPSDAHDPAIHDGHRIDSVALHVDGWTEYRPLEALTLTGARGWSGMCDIGKKAAGRLLDGVLHDDYPEAP